MVVHSTAVADAPGGYSAVSLKVNAALLSSSFEGYKLSLDTVPVHKVPFCTREVKQSTSQWAFQYSALFTSCNLLFDANDGRTCLCVDSEWNLVRCSRQDSKLSVSKVCNLKDHGAAAADNDAVPPSERLPLNAVPISDDCLLLCDGGVNVFVLTGLSTEGCVPSVVQLQMPVKGFFLRTGRFSKVGSRATLKVVGQSIQQHTTQGDSLAGGSPYVSALHILTFAGDELAGKGWVLESHDVLNVSQGGRLLFAHWCDGTDGEEGVLHAVTEGGSLTWQKTGDSVAGTGSLAKNASYAWAQDATHVYAMVSLPPELEVASVDDLVWHLTATAVGLSTRTETTLLAGTLPLGVVPNESGISLLENKVEIKLKKASTNETWSELLVGDGGGQQLKQLADWVTSGDSDGGQDKNGSGSLYGREDCDAAVDTFLHLIVGCGEKKDVRKVDLFGHQFLFGRQSCVSDTTDRPPITSLCLRYDVDGLIFRNNTHSDSQKGAAPLPYEHVDTFDALGFVAAGKMSKKFVTCSPSASYAVIADVHRHVYVYWKPGGSMAGHELRNRKTGTKNRIARQQVLTVGGAAVLGICALDSVLFVLTDEELLGFAMQNEDLLEP